ncbi:unnamed protein product [Effrenium voratum]|nr:unnamed protein product [Effrenium voratum]
MAIFFLQVHDNWKIPTLPTTCFTHDWVDSSAINKVKWQAPQLPLTTLLYDFFSFYAQEYNWQEEVISVRLGRRAFRQEISNFQNLVGAASAARLHIEDPFLLDRNLNCTLGMEQEAQLKVKIRMTYETLAAWEMPAAFQSTKTSRSSIRNVPSTLVTNGGKKPKKPTAEADAAPDAAQVPVPKFLR